MNKIIFGTLGLLVIIGLGAYLYNKEQTVQPNVVVEENTEVVIQEEVPAPVPPISNDLLVVDTPLPGASVTSPIQVSGQARGYWFFEATAPVTVTNWDGLIIGQGYIEADGDWMTEDFVPFTGEITYQQEPNAYSATGTIIFMKDNPSALPENDAAYEMQVQLDDNSN